LIKVSSGTLGVLGLAETWLDAPPTTAYLMVGGRCRRDCAFCAQARSSRASALALSRVTWPQWDEEETLSAVEEAYSRGSIQRCCLQVTVGPGNLDRVRAIATRLGRRVPLSVSVVANVDQAEELLEAGVERIGLSLDAVNEETFHRVKGGDLRAYLAVIEEAARRFADRVSTHVMAGLGETEEEMVRMIDLLHGWGVIPALFAFTPIPGTAMEDQASPSVSSYRRVQIATHLMVNGWVTGKDFAFSPRGRVVSFGLGRDELERALLDGNAFRTSGCRGCNRPYYNEPPRGPFYNYPRSLDAREVTSALQEALSGPVRW
jgi:biotin synthase-related radical SAM superfamily protein